MGESGTCRQNRAVETTDWAGSEEWNKSRAVAPSHNVQDGRKIIHIAGSKLLNEVSQGKTLEVERVRKCVPGCSFGGATGLRLK